MMRFGNMNKFFENEKKNWNCSATHTTQCESLWTHTFVPLCSFSWNSWQLLSNNFSRLLLLSLVLVWCVHVLYLALFVSSIVSIFRGIVSQSIAWYRSTVFKIKRQLIFFSSYEHFRAVIELNMHWITIDIPKKHRITSEWVMAMMSSLVK